MNSVLTTSNGTPVIAGVVTQLIELIGLAIFFILYLLVIIFAMCVIVITLFRINLTLFEGINSIFKEYLGLWYSFPNGTTPELLDVPGLLIDQLISLSSVLYLFVFQILFIIAVYYALRGIFESRPRNNIRAIFCLLLIFIFPLIIFGFRDVLDLFNVIDVPNTLELILLFRDRDIFILFGLIDPLNDLQISLVLWEYFQSTFPNYPSIGEWAIAMDAYLTQLQEPVTFIDISSIYAILNPSSLSITQLPTEDILAFLGSAVIVFVILCYLYLEIAFQINYIDLVTQPSLERSERLETQLALLQKESASITANVEKFKKEAKAKMEELGLEKASVTKFIRKKDEKFSYVKEMIEKKKLEEEEKKLIYAASKTRRLGRYIERIFREDPEAEAALTASSSAPKAKNIAKSTIINSVIRVAILITISFIIINTRQVLQGLPPAISESVAMVSPEIILLLLLPFLLSFPIIAKVIAYIKQRNLVLRLQQEEKVQEIIASVGDYVKKEDLEEEEDLEEQPSIGVEEEATTEPP